MNCSGDENLLYLLKQNFGSNASVWSEVGDHGVECERVVSNATSSSSSSSVYELGMDLYGYCSPLIVLVGLAGNSISLKVFTSRVMRRLSSSYYLSMLSASDMLVLLTYVLLDWLDKGLSRWPGAHRVPVVHYPGVCHVFLYLSYTTRFTSVWLIVAFSAERYIAICHTKYRKRLCSKVYARRITLAVCLIGCLLCLYKPLISGSFAPNDVSSMRTNSSESGAASASVQSGGVGGQLCMRSPNNVHLNYVLDATFSVLITAVPSMLISGFSAPILRRLIARYRKRKETRLVFRTNRIRLEFSVILLSISSCFLLLTVPYMVVWSVQFWLSLHPDIQSPREHEKISGLLFITRTIFYLNYCINFFLYCLTGAYYRREIKSLLKLSGRARREGSIVSRQHHLDRTPLRRT